MLQRDQTKKQDQQYSSNILKGTLLNLAWTRETAEEETTSKPRSNPSFPHHAMFIVSLSFDCLSFLNRSTAMSKQILYYTSSKSGCEDKDFAGVMVSTREISAIRRRSDGRIIHSLQIRQKARALGSAWFQLFLFQVVRYIFNWKREDRKR